MGKETMVAGFTSAELDAEEQNRDRLGRCSGSSEPGPCSSPHPKEHA